MGVGTVELSVLLHGQLIPGLQLGLVSSMSAAFLWVREDLLFDQTSLRSKVIGMRLVTSSPGPWQSVARGRKWLAASGHHRPPAASTLRRAYRAALGGSGSRVSADRSWATIRFGRPAAGAVHQETKLSRPRGGVGVGCREPMPVGVHRERDRAVT